MLQKDPWDLPLAPFGPLLEASWRQLGPNFASLVPNLNPFDLILAHFGPNLPHLGASVLLQDPFGHPSGPSLDDLGSFWMPFEPIWTPKCAQFGRFELIFEAI